MQRFREQKRQYNDQSGLRVLLEKQIGAHLKYFQIKTHVQTARESHDLNMDFRSFNKGFKQLCIMYFMQEQVIDICTNCPEV